MFPLLRLVVALAMGDVYLRRRPKRPVPGMEEAYHEHTERTAHKGPHRILRYIGPID